LSTPLIGHQPDDVRAGTLIGWVTGRL